MARADVEIVALTTDLLPAYYAFARNAFGTHSYQAREGFTRWLYEESPLTRLTDAKVAVVDGAVVGCFHKMRLPWELSDGVGPVAAPNNLFVNREYRSQGVGLALILEAIAGDKDVVLFGAGPGVQPIYEKLGARPIETHWAQTVVNPVSAPAISALHWVWPRASDRMIALTHSLARSGLPSEIADRLVENARGKAHPKWTADLVRWRFFSPHGPRHVLARAKNGFAILSIGIHRTLYTARTVESCGEPVLATRLLLAAMGVNAWLAMSSQPIRAAGFWKMKNAPVVFELHKPKSRSFGPIALSGGAGDYGFEALPLDRER